jgi:hypothetical protein
MLRRKIQKPHASEIWPNSFQQELLRFDAVELKFGDDVSEQFEEQTGRGGVKKLKCFWMLQFFQMVLKRSLLSWRGAFRFL